MRKQSRKNGKRVAYDLLDNDDFTNVKHDILCTNCNHTRHDHLYTCNEAFYAHTPIRANHCLITICDCKLFTLITFESTIEDLINDEDI